MIRKSLSIAFGLIVFALIGGIFLFLRVTPPPPVTVQANAATSVSNSETDIVATATLRFESPLPLPTDAPTPTPTPLPAPYPDLKLSSVEPVTTGPYLNVIWSPDGTKALVGKEYDTRYRLDSDTDVGIGNLWLLDLKAKTETRLLEKVGRYNWSPDGTSVVLINPAQVDGIDGLLQIYALSTGKLTTLTQVDFLGSDYDPQWLPTDKIIFVRDGQLWSIGADGTNEYAMPNFPFVSMTRRSDVILHQDQPEALLGFHFSPDGKSIAYLTRHENMRAIARNLWSADADGANPRLITGQAEGSYYSWSPDSTRLLFNTYRDMDDPFLDERLERWRGLWVADADGKHAQPVHHIEDWGAIISPVWSLDGSKVAFIDFQRDDLDKATDIWITDVTDKGQAGPIVRETTAAIRLIWWWPDSTAILATQTDEDIISPQAMTTNRFILDKPQTP